MTNKNNTMAHLVVKLDDPRYGAGPGTVVGFVDSVEEFLARTTDRDGARDPAMRVWLDDSVQPLTVGDRVVMRLMAVGKVE